MPDPRPLLTSHPIPEQETRRNVQSPSDLPRAGRPPLQLSRAESDQDTPPRPSPAALGLQSGRPAQLRDPVPEAQCPLLPASRDGPPAPGRRLRSAAPRGGARATRPRPQHASSGLAPPTARPRGAEWESERGARPRRPHPVRACCSPSSRPPPNRSLSSHWPSGRPPRLAWPMEMLEACEWLERAGRKHVLRCLPHPAY
ncbi:basic proline-rich protein-like [Vombatus ursinus]|uniref:basic proline-rich protein-like n=1 Tax=Vombatus ursinus TaxID=29139 RepID=UPI000FFD0057|nr:basic proline-rich protein-like [Vombatus ursinus]